MSHNELRQPWKLYLQQLAEADKINPPLTFDQTIESETEDDTKVNLCPGSDQCSYEPHPLGSTKACANIESTIGVVFMNSTG